MATVHSMVAELEALRTAPIVEPYAGPAILSGPASGVFFHEILGHRLEGHRQKSVRDGQTFRRMVGQTVLPESFSVYFDPTVTQVAGNDLVGSYRFDNEGVKARRVPVIENGILTGFLMGRIPIEGFPKSNGHGRKNTGYRTVARQSNLFVDVADRHTRSELKAMLLEAVARENKPFGLFFDRIEGGYTFTGRSIPNSFNVTPTMVYRIHPDGSEELVRGADLIGTPLTTFSRHRRRRRRTRGIQRHLRCGVGASAGGGHIAVDPRRADRGAEEGDSPGSAADPPSRLDSPSMPHTPMEMHDEPAPRHRGVLPWVRRLACSRDGRAR